MEQQDSPRVSARALSGEFDKREKRIWSNLSHSLFTKPVVGVMDFLSASTEGIRNTTTVFDQADLDRVRLPRFISPDGVLRVSSSV